MKGKGSGRCLRPEELGLGRAAPATHLQPLHGGRAGEGAPREEAGGCLDPTAAGTGPNVSGGSCRALAVASEGLGLPEQTCAAAGVSGRAGRKCLTPRKCLPGSSTSSRCLGRAFTLTFWPALPKPGGSHGGFQRVQQALGRLFLALL